MKPESSSGSSSHHQKFRGLKVAGLAILGVFALYLLTLAYPGYLFGYSITYKNFKVYSTQSISTNIYRELDASEKALSRSELYRPGLTQRIYLCNSYTLYGFLAPLSLEAFAANYPLTNYIFVARSSIRNDLAFRKEGNATITRPMSRLITHETTHTLIKEKIGLWKNSNLAMWKKEGYCDYIAYDDSNAVKDAKEILTAHANDRSGSTTYRKFYYAVAYLKERLNMNFNEIVATKLTLNQVLTDIELMKDAKPQ